MSELGLDEATKTAALVLLTAIVKKPFERVGEIINTRMSYWQFRNMYVVGERSRDFLSRKGVDIADLPPKLREVVPILESAKNEDDPTLQEMWASLLTTVLDPDAPESALPYHEILKSISPLEARLLSDFSVVVNALGSESFADRSYEGQTKRLSQTLNIELQLVVLALEHLKHLGLVLFPEPEGYDAVVTLRSIKGIPNDRIKFIRLSELGRAFLQRCTYIADNA